MRFRLIRVRCACKTPRSSIRDALNTWMKFSNEAVLLERACHARRNLCGCVLEGPAPRLLSCTRVNSTHSGPISGLFMKRTLIKLFIGIKHQRRHVDERRHEQRTYLHVSQKRGGLKDPPEPLVRLEGVVPRKLAPRSVRV